jgi:GlpG protein
MRLIGQLPEEAQARRFSDFLIAKGVRNEIERDGNEAWSLWVHDENQVSEARDWFTRFSAAPGAAEFRNAAPEAAKVREAEARESAEYRRRLSTRQRLFADSGRHTAGILTYVLIVACVAVAVFSRLGRDEGVLGPLFISDPGTDSTGFLHDVLAGQVWRLFTPVFIHFGVAHLLFNMLWLFQLGSMIEGRQGHIRFALLVLGLAAGSNIAQYAYAGPSFGGMSGVVYGLFGYIWLRGRFDPASGLFMDRQNVILMVVWFVACFTGLVGPVANGAHAAGVILGAACGYLSAQVALRR